ncbi:hypothetical protein [Vallitalea sp.]|jgi:hypothetical protein|uniref:hypothetical protein n=1 Tax=Vallitalea sp. TaxID=1882829 RepID=UPI0025F4B565|nr:hypothetical protein [Vallitalea sp.]MCT4687692.1 hypothetical protein [Vallitalea sp.]
MDNGIAKDRIPIPIMINYLPHDCDFPSMYSQACKGESRVNTPYLMIKFNGRNNLSIAFEKEKDENILFYY